MSLQGKVALVTGASRGIGQAIALELGRQGAIVIGTATSASGAERIAATLKENGVQGTGMELNVTSNESVAAVLASIQEQFGAPAILVNNAGITRDAMFHKMTPEQWGEVIDTNLTGLFNMTHPVWTGMRDRSFGRVINISSINGQKGQMGQANYSAAKAGDLGFTKALAQEGAAKGITVNAICPGYIGTEMVRAIPEKVLNERIIPQIPVGRLGEPDEIARIVVFLASDDAGFITGSTISANGGQFFV